MGLKYKDNPLCKVIGSVWLLIALANLGLLIFSITNFTGEFGLLMSPLLILTIVLSAILAIFYFKINTIDYLRLEGNSLSIYKGLIFPRTNIDISEIEQGRMIGSSLFLIGSNGKEVKINLSQLTLQDCERLKEKLGDHMKI